MQPALLSPANLGCSTSGSSRAYGTVTILKRKVQDVTASVEVTEPYINGSTSDPIQSVATRKRTRTSRKVTSLELRANVMREILAPFEQEARKGEQDRICLLTTSDYIVSGCVGMSVNVMRPFFIALDTGCGPNIIRRRDLPFGRECPLIVNDDLPNLGDANGNPLKLAGKVMLRVQLGGATYRVMFVVAEHLAVSVILGTSFMNKQVHGIMCMDGHVRLTRSVAVSYRVIKLL